MSVTDDAVARLEVRGGTKRFGAVTALDHVDFSVYAGEIVALLGDNGAGKSTLIKCISGVHHFDSGTFCVDGRPVAPRSPQAAKALGIETVYQDLALFDNLAAAENFYAGRELTWPRRGAGPFGWVRRRAMQEGTNAALERLQVGIHDARIPIGLMSGGQRQAVAVARTEAFSSRIVILDEPTAALGVRESRNVLEVVRRLPERGASVILVSHNLEQVMEVADRAIVFRQGKRVGEVTPTRENHELMVSLIVGGA